MRVIDEGDDFECDIVVDIDDIMPNTWNANRMEPKKFRALKRSLKAYPDILNGQRLIVWQNPECPDNYEILNGEHRWRACKEIGVTELPCYVVKNITLAQAKLITMAMSNTGKEDDAKKVAVIKTILNDYKTDEIANLIGVDGVELRTLVESMISTPDEIVKAFDSYKTGGDPVEPSDAEMKEAMNIFATIDDDDEGSDLDVGSMSDGHQPTPSKPAPKQERLKPTGPKMCKTSPGYIDATGDIPVMTMDTWHHVRKLMMWQFDHDGKIDAQTMIEQACASYMADVDAMRGLVE